MLTGCYRCPCPRAEKHPRPSLAQKSPIQCFSRRTVTQSHVLLQAEELREFERGLAGPLRVVQGNPGPEPQHLRRQGALTALLGEESHLQSPIMAPYICTHFTQSLFILKIHFSPTDGRLQEEPRAHQRPCPRPFGSSLSGRLQRSPGKESTFPATGDFCTRAAGPHPHSQGRQSFCLNVVYRGSHQHKVSRSGPGWGAGVQKLVLVSGGCR